MNMEKILGTPTMMLLPARKYAFTVSKQEYTIKIPRRGKYKDLDPKFFKEEDGGFDILADYEDDEEEGIENVLYMPSISKVLFATATYPDLKEDQAFTPIALIVKKDEIEIIGQIVQMIREESTNVQ